MQVSLTSTDT